MRITRRIRDNSRVLMLIAMALLLVVFLLGDVINSMSHSGGEQNFAVAKVFGRTLRARELAALHQDQRIAASFQIGTPPVWADSDAQVSDGRALLILEAEHLGVRVPREQVIQMLAQAQVPGTYLEEVRRQTGRSLNSIYDAIGRVLATRTLYAMQLEAALTESLPRLEKLYRDQNQIADVLLSIIDAKALLDEVPEPTEEQLLEHFEQFKDRTPAHTEDELVFGYRSPDRVQVEYLTVDPAEIQPSVRVSRREAEAFYEANRPRYVRPLEGPQPDSPEAGPPQVQMTFEEAEPRVREDARAAKAIEEAQRLVNEMLEAARREFRADADPQTQAALFTAIRERFRDRHPIAHRTTALATAAELRTELGFGRAQLLIGRRSISAVDLALRVQGIVEPQEGDELPLLALYEPAPDPGIEARPDPTGRPVPYQAYMFRVIQVSPAGPPASLDEVRDQVRADWKLARAHELAGEQARALAEAARTVGLRQAVEAATDLRARLETDAGSDTSSAPSASAAALLGPTRPANFRRQASPLANLGLAPELHKKVFALGELPEAEGVHRVLAAPVAKNFKWVVAELEGVRPIYQGDFDAKRENLERTTMFTRQSEFMRQWGDIANIHARTGYVNLRAGEQPQ